MGLFTVKKYKFIKDKNGNKIEVEKSKEEWDKETKNGKAIHYFSDRYTINGTTLQFTSKVFEKKRDAADHERMFLNDPVNYILKYGKRAKKKVLEILNQNNSEKIKFYDNNSKKINDYFNDFMKYKSNFVKQATLYEYRTKWNKFFYDDFGQEEITYISEDTNLKLHERIALQVNQKTNISYSLSWKNHMHSILAEFFEYLKRKGLIERNYANNYGGFKNPNENKNKKTEIKYQTLEEYELFMSVVDDWFWYSVFNFMFWHGPRKGEQRALKIKNCNPTEQMIKFDSTFSKSLTGGEIIGPIKNNKERTIFMAEQSKDHIEKLISFYKAMAGYNDDWFLFGGPNKMSKNKIDRMLSYYYDKLEKMYPNKKINRLTHHEFGRHSHASFLLNVGTDRLDIYFLIAERLGDTVEVIRETYAKPYTDLNITKSKELLSNNNIKNSLKF